MTGIPRVPGAYRQFAAAISVTLAVLAAGTCIGWASSAVPEFQRGKAPVVITPEEISWVVSLLDIGNTISPLPMCFLSDTMGRKTILLFSGVLIFANFVLTYLATEPWMLYLGRFLGGFGKGVMFALVPVYLGEIASAPIRGAVSSMFALSLYLGILFAYAIGPYVSFEMLAFLCGIFPLVFFFTFIFFPESPYFLLMKGQKEDAHKALMWLRNTRFEIKDEIYSLREEFQEIAASVEEDMKNKGRIYNLLSTKGNRRAILIVVVLAAVQKLSGINAFLFYTSITLPPNDIIKPDLAVIVFGTVLTVFSCFSFIFVDSLGRRFLLLVSSFFCFLSTATNAVFYFLYYENKSETEPFLWVPYVSLLIFGIFFPHGLVSALTTLNGELFSTDVKGFSNAIAATISGICAFLVDKMYITVNENVGIYANFAFFAAVCLFSFIFTYIFVIETKGMTLVEIQRQLNKSSSMKFETKL